MQPFHAEVRNAETAEISLSMYVFISIISGHYISYTVQMKWKRQDDALTKNNNNPGSLVT